MNVILCFQYNKRKYVIFEKDTKVLLSSYDENKLTSIEDTEKLFLKDFINALCSNEFSEINFIKNKNIIVCEKNLTLLDDLSCFITLDIGDKKDIFFMNCDSLYTVSKKVNHKINYKPIIVIFIIIMILTILLVFFKTSSKKDNSELLEKYTFIRDERLADFYEMELKIVNITNKESTNIFNDTYVKFENPYNGYSLVSSTSKKEGTGLDLNIYEGTSIPPMAIWYVEGAHNGGIDFSEAEELENKYDISVKEVFERHKIKNELDIMYNVILYSDKQVDSNSTKEEIIDKLVFEFYRPLVLPYQEQSIMDKIIFFSGDKIGYAFGNNKQIFINLEHNGSEYRIVYEYDNLGQQKLNETEIVNIVSSLEFIQN